MIEVAENPRAVIGGNQPEPTPYEAIKLHIDDLMETAQGFLDGEPITTQGAADEVGRLLAAARDAEKAAETQRKIEAKPFDDGKAAVQALWKPITSRCALITSTAKQALAPFLAAEQARKDSDAAEARRIADEKRAEAQAAMRSVNVTDLASVEAAEALLKDATRADKAATRAGNDKAMAAGGGRSVSLRSVWIATMTDPVAALSHYRKTQPEALKAWLADQAAKDVHSGARAIPGFTVTEEKVAR